MRGSNRLNLIFFLDFLSEIESKVQIFYWRVRGLNGLLQFTYFAEKRAKHYFVK